MSAALALLAGSVPAPAEPARGELPRRAILGTSLETTPSGLVVREVAAGATGSRLGMAAGDLLTSIDGVPVHSVPDAAARIRAHKAGDRVVVGVVRAGRPLRLSGKAAGRPLETYAGARVRYGAVSYSEGRLRDILVEPAGVAHPPVVFMIQGYNCGTIEAGVPESEYGRLADAFAKAGIAYYRVEKPGVGDADGPLDCAVIDYAQELAAFRAAYYHLTDNLGYEPDRVFMLGHSLGGLEAPMLAAERSPRGVAVYGTVLRNWSDYTHDIDRYQEFLLLGADPVDEAEHAEAHHELMRLFFDERRPPAEIAREHPDLAEALRSVLGWDGGIRDYGRSYVLLQDLARQPLMRAWRDTRSRVLALYGATDEIALFPDDHRMIADVVNHYRPGTAEYVEVPRTMHGMDLVGDRDEFRRRNVAAGGIVPGPFNPAVASAIVSWVKASMAKPPVRSLPDGNAGPAKG